MYNKVLRLMLENIIDTDVFLCAKRTLAIQNLAMNLWKRNHSEPLDKDEVGLFLSDSPNTKLTEEQKQLVSSCRSQINNCFLDAVFHIFLCSEMVGKQVVRDAEEYRQIFPTWSSAEVTPLCPL